jgi:hypothetical protein
MPESKMSLFLYPGQTRKASLDGGAQVLERFAARFDFPTASVEIEVVTNDGRSRITTMHIEETDQRGVTGVVVGRVSASQLLGRAVHGAAWISSAPTGLTLEAFQVDARRVNAAAGVAIRRKMSDDRLARITAILDGGGDVNNVMEAEHVGERQAFRLIKRAREVQR